MHSPLESIIGKQEIWDSLSSIIFIASKIDVEGSIEIGLEFIKYSLKPSLVYDKIEISGGKIFHIKNNSYPLVIHLPGCNYDKNARYNEIIKKIYNDEDKLVEGFTKFTYKNTFRGGLLLLILLTIYTIKNN